MADLRPFRIQAETQMKANQVVIKLTTAQKDALLLFEAYRKRIKPIPKNVNEEAVEAFTTASADSQVSYASATIASLAMNLVCEQLWPVNEVESRAWLLKAV